MSRSFLIISLNYSLIKYLNKRKEEITFNHRHRSLFSLIRLRTREIPFRLGVRCCENYGQQTEKCLINFSENTKKSFPPRLFSIARLGNTKSSLYFIKKAARKFLYRAIIMMIISAHKKT